MEDNEPSSESPENVTGGDVLAAKPTWARAILSRRTVIGGGLVAVAGWALLPPIQRRLEAYSDYLVGIGSDHIMDALGAGVVQVLRFDQYDYFYGTVRKISVRGLLEDSYPLPGSTWGSFPESVDYIPSWSGIFMVLSTTRADVSFMGIRFHESHQKMVDRELVVTEGGGDGPHIHAYVSTDGDGRVRIKYSSGSDEVFLNAIRLPLEPGVEYKLDVSFSPRDPSIYEWSVDVLFYRSSTTEYSVIQYGPFRTGGVPIGNKQILIAGDGSVKRVPRDDYLGEWIQRIFSG